MLRGEPAGALWSICKLAIAEIDGWCPFEHRQIPDRGPM